MHLVNAIVLDKQTPLPEGTLADLSVDTWVEAQLSVDGKSIVAILARGPVLDLEGTILAAAVPASEASANDARSMTAVPAGSLEDVQRLHILSVLKSTEGVVEGAHGAATILGMHPNTLRSRMKKLGIATTSRGAA